MKLYLKILYWFIATVTLISCKEIIEFDERSVRDALVVSGILENGKQVDIRLSKTINRFKNSEFEPVENLSVVLFENENRIGELRHVSRGRYVSDGFVAKAGNSYRIEISDNMLKIASAETLVPAPLPIIKIDTISKIIDGKKKLQVKLTFSDPSNSNNFYRIEPQEQLFIPYLTASNNVSVRMITIPGLINTEANWLLRGMGFYNLNDKFHDWAGNQFYIFSDKYIQGQVFTLDMEMPYFRTDSVLGTNRKIYFQQLSRDYFYYLRSVMQQLSISNNPFSEPVQIHSNISGGVGIFGAFSQTVDSIIHINWALIDSLFPGITLPGNLYPLNNTTPAFVGRPNLQDF